VGGILARRADALDLTNRAAGFIEGTFSCVVDEFFFYGDPEPTGEVRIEGSFTATADRRA
jgi:hypothetical protein